MSKDRVQDWDKIITVENAIQSYLESAIERTEEEFRAFHQVMLDRLQDLQGFIVPTTEEVLEVLRPILAQGKKKPS